MARYHGKKSRLQVHSSPGHHTSSGFSKDIIGFFSSLWNWGLDHWVVLAGICAGIFIAFSIILIMDFGKVKALATFKPNVTTKIYDKNDVLISELFRQKREVVPIERIPKNLINAFIAIEDNEFYDHFGINIKGIVRAFFINVFAGRIRQGGSTITQQTAKVLLTSRRRNIYRKIKEAFISLMMEFYYTKDEILSLYLNQIYLGHGTYGVESASRLYFQKHVWELNLAESALIATLPSAPNRLTPIRHTKTSMGRHKIVLAKMVEMGFITVEEAEKAYLDFWPSYLNYISEIAPSINTWSNRVDRAPWFTEYIRRKLVDQFGEETVYEKGLLVYTTLDIKKQEAGQRILKDALERQTVISGNLSFKNDDYIVDHISYEIQLLQDLFDIAPFRKRGSRELMKLNSHIRDEIIEELEGLNYFAGIAPVDRMIQDYRRTFSQDKDLQKVEGCIISINHNNGYIEAMIGGSEFSSINQLNRPLQSKRQPGSSIKPLLYTSAIESKKFTPSTTVLDSPIVYLDNEGGDWLPENYTGSYHGLVRLRKALALSINVVSIRIADVLGIDHVQRYYSKLLKFDEKEAKKRIPRNFSIALGSLEVSPFELARAYAIIANGGRDVVPFAVRYIKDHDGNLILNKEEEIKHLIEKEKKNGTYQIIRADTAQVMISMLQSVVAGGTGGAASPGRPAAGKTGTTNNWKDAWFVGFVPNLTTAIWIGYDKLGLSLGVHQSGGSVAAPIWGKYMRAALAHEPVLGFPSYAGLEGKEVCSRSGLLPSSSCRNIINEIFIPGTVPEESCELCATIEDSLRVSTKGPGVNISRKQKNEMKNKIDDDTGTSIIENIDDDLLDE